MDVILVTGTPGTGKTYLANRLSEHFGYNYVDLNSLSREKGWVIGFDKGRDCDIIDEELLNSEIGQYIDDLGKSGKKGIILDSHMAQFVPTDLVSLCIVVRSDLNTLKLRLEARGYSPSKVRENLDSEIFDICKIEAIEEGHNVLEMSSSGDLSIVSKSLE